MSGDAFEFRGSRSQIVTTCYGCDSQEWKNRFRAMRRTREFIGPYYYQPVEQQIKLGWLPA